MSRVSIYLSSYNHAEHLREAIDSVLGQTFSDYELFIFDDASSDESWSIIKSYADTRIHAIKNGTNRNDKVGMHKVIMEMASGEFIAIHHSDNVWEPEKLQKQVDHLDAHPEIGAVFTNAQIIGVTGEQVKDKSHVFYKIFDQPNRSRYEWLGYFFYRGNALCHPSVLIRKKCYYECSFYRNGFAQIPDLDMWVRLCMKYEIHVMHQELVRYRVRDDEMYSSGNRPETRIRAQFEYLHMLDNYLKIATFQELVRVFPAAKKYYCKTGFDCGYVLGRLALETSEQAYTQLFGLNLLFDAINDPERMKTLNECYGFFHKDFIGLTARYDIFSSELKNSTSMQAILKEQKIKEMTSSRAWKAAMLFRRMRVFLLPPGSRRAQLIRKLLALNKNRV
jgi:glycosyltransferase involved in cell wall biosynthesis